MDERLHQVTLHRSPALGITAMELASSHRFPRHAHDEYGIGVLMDGAQRSWSGRGTVESVAGDVITVNPGELHDGSPLGGAARRWRIIYVDRATMAARWAPEARGTAEFVSPSCTDTRLARWVHRLFDRLLDGSDAMGIEEIGEHLLHRLGSPAVMGQPSDSSGPALVHRAVERIVDDPAAPTSLADLATLCGLGRYQFVRAFTRSVGTTPHAYVVQQRVRLARQLIVRGEPLADAAAHAGFSDQSHMTRAFARHYGVPPGRYVASGRRAASAAVEH